MLSSWFTRLRDVKAGSKHKEVHSPSPCAKRRNDDPANFAKSWSLQRANSKAKNVRVEADNTSACDDSCPSISDESMPLGAAQSVCNSQALELGKDALLMHHCANFDPWDRDFISMSSCEVASKLLSSKEIKSLAQKGHGVSDNDTEDFALTSETRSSFCSETSSADSSVSCKSGCEEKGNQDEQNWREGEDAIKSSGILSENLQINCVAGEQNGSHGADSTTDMMSACCQKNVQMRRDIWRGTGSFLLSHLTAGQCCSVGSNIFYESNGGRESLKASGACSLTENRTSLIKKNEPHSTVESVTSSSTQCAQSEGAEESKRRAWRRRRRGASISAVLPPDLQGVVGDSLALVKMSDNPYEDFRQSIYEMIMEKDLEGSMDVEELLYCYLSLNAPEHHELIKEVFSDVWSAILMTLR